MKAAVRALEEKIGGLHDRVYVLEGAGEEKRSSSSEVEYGRDWRWESGNWWFRIPAVRCVRVNARCRRKVSRSMRQMLEQEGWRKGDEKWNTWLKERESLAMVGRWVLMMFVSTKADRISRKPGAGDQGHVDVGREFSGRSLAVVPGVQQSSRFHVTSWVLVDSRQQCGELAEWQELCLPC